MFKEENKENLLAYEAADESAAAAEGTAESVQEPAEEKRKEKNGGLRIKPKKSWIPVLFILPALAFLIMFNYVPMYGILIAFQDYVPGDDFLSEYPSSYFFSCMCTVTCG